MTPEDFIRAYAQALGSQSWNEVDPLIHDDACVTFSNGTVHKGKADVKSAFERNFSLIKDEKYSITNVHWVIKGTEMAVYLFDYQWSGIIGGKAANGSGRGSSVLINENGRWKLLIEHLGLREN